MTYAADGPNQMLPVRACMAANVTLRFLNVYRAPDAAVTDITAALAVGALTEFPVHRFPLDGIVGAHEAAEGSAVGQVIVTPA